MLSTMSSLDEAPSVNDPSGKPAKPGCPCHSTRTIATISPSRSALAAGGQAPVVVAETNTGHLLLLAPGDLEACDGSIDRLVEAIEQATTRAGLAWTTR